METGFYSPVKDGTKKQERKSPWDYRCPEYDERTSCYVNTGSHHGIGHRQPVGNPGNPIPFIKALPFGRPKTQRTAYIPPEQLEQDYVE
jgi:hypothetical protein